MGQNSAAKARTKQALKNTKKGKELRKHTKRLRGCSYCSDCSCKVKINKLTKRAKRPLFVFGENS